MFYIEKGGQVPPSSVVCSRTITRFLFREGLVVPESPCSNGTDSDLTNSTTWEPVFSPLWPCLCLTRITWFWVSKFPFRVSIWEVHPNSSGRVRENSERKGFPYKIKVFTVPLVYHRRSTSCRVLILRLRVRNSSFSPHDHGPRSPSPIPHPGRATPRRQMKWRRTSGG